MGQRGNKPSFQSVVDLGLRDVGVRNQPRRLAAQLGKGWLLSLLLIFLSVGVTCAVIRATGAGRWAAIPAALLWTGALVAVALRSAKRSPIVVVRVTADRPTRAGWVLVAPFVLLSLAGALRGDPLVMPPAALTLVMVVLVWRGRQRVPDVLRRLRPLLASDESVLGDGVGMERPPWSWHEAFRLVVATDRRLVVTGAASRDAFVVIDAPYARVSRFGIDWRYRGRMGALSLTVVGVGDEPTDTHVISIAPASLVSIARALRAHGVPPDDRAAVDEAEALWEQARVQHRRKEREPLFDRGAMHTRGFDRGLWLFLAICAAAFYFSPSASPVALLVAVGAAGGVAGYVAGTRASFAYLVPFNLLLAPALFFMFTSDVMSLMVGLSLVAALGLWVGSSLRTARRGRAPTVHGPRPPRGTLRYTVGGVSLIRLSAIVLAGAVALTAAGAAAGFDQTTLRVLYDQLTRKQLPVDGRSNLAGGAASFTYTPGPGLHELLTDQHFGGDRYDGARWELRSGWTKGLNVVSLASYVESPRLDNPAAVAKFVARKDREHTRLAGFRVSHTTRVVDGRNGYVWNHGSHIGVWFFAAWFPRPGYTVRVECIAKHEKDRFRRLCAEAMRTLRFHGG